MEHKHFQLIHMRTLTHFHTCSARLCVDLFSCFTHYSTMCVILWLPFLEVTLKQQEAGERQRQWQPTFRTGFLLLSRPISRERWECSVDLHQLGKAGGKATHSAQLLLLVVTVATGGTTYPDLLTHTHTQARLCTHTHSVTQVCRDGSQAFKTCLSYYVSCHATCSACR